MIQFALVILTAHFIYMGTIQARAQMGGGGWRPRGPPLPLEIEKPKKRSSEKI